MHDQQQQQPTREDLASIYLSQQIADLVRQLATVSADLQLERAESAGKDARIASLTAGLHEQDGGNDEQQPA